MTDQSDLDLSCASSSFENYSSEEVESGTVEPYQYEPVASDASSRSDSEDSDGGDEEHNRLSNTDWLVVNILYSIVYSTEPGTRKPLQCIASILQVYVWKVSNNANCQRVCLLL